MKTKKCMEKEQHSQKAKSALTGYLSSAKTMIDRCRPSNPPEKPCRPHFKEIDEDDDAAEAFGTGGTDKEASASVSISDDTLYDSKKSP